MLKRRTVKGSDVSVWVMLATIYNPPGGSNQPRSPYSQALEDLIQRRKRDHEIISLIRFHWNLRASQI